MLPMAGPLDKDTWPVRLNACDGEVAMIIKLSVRAIWFQWAFL